MSADGPGGPPLAWSGSDGDAAALLIHCTLAHSGAWHGVAAHLPSWTAPDLPGHGRSADVPPGCDLLDLCVAGVGSVRDRAGAGHLVGHSYGAVVALRLAAESPGRVRSLTLIEPVLFAAAAGTPEHAVHVAAHRPVEAGLAAGRPEDAARAFTAQWGDGRPWDTLPARTRAYMTGRIGLVARQAPGIGEDRSNLLAPGWIERIQAPVLLIEGGASPPVVGAIQAALAARLPRAERVVVAGAGHMAPVTHPDEVGRAVAAHVARAG